MRCCAAQHSGLLSANGVPVCFIISVTLMTCIPLPPPQTIYCPAANCGVVVDECTVLSVWPHCRVCACSCLVLTPPPLPLPLPLPSACRRIIQDASVRGKYRYLITNSFVQANRTLKWCPSPGCGNAVMATDREEQGVRCHCGKDFW